MKGIKLSLLLLLLCYCCCCCCCCCCCYCCCCCSCIHETTENSGKDCSQRKIFKSIKQSNDGLNTRRYTVQVRNHPKPNCLCLKTNHPPHQFFGAESLKSDSFLNQSGNPPNFVKPKDSLLHSKRPVTCPCPDPDRIQSTP